MKNKRATECWNILRGELDSAIDSYVPMKKQGKRSKKKHLSKEAFRKIRHKQNMWRVYKHTGKDKDYEAYKEALNAATNEVRKSKRNFEHKLAQNIKSDSKSFYAYVRSKQNVRDKVGPLEDNFGNIVTQGFLMAEELHFSSVFTREDTSSLPVPETKFKGSEGERLGQLVVTPEVVASKINNMKENKSPGVDGISPKILKETVEQISTPLAHVFNMSLQEGIIPLEWKEANIVPLFKKGSRNKSVNYRPVSLTSVICKLLETIIRDHMMDFLVKHKLTNPSQHGFLKARSWLKVGLYFRRRQALWHAFIRLPNAYKSVLRRICLYFSRRHQRASTRARKRSSARDATKFNNAELSRFTPANASNSANHLPLSRIEFAADRSCNYVREVALDNQLVATES